MVKVISSKEVLESKRSNFSISRVFFLQEFGQSTPEFRKSARKIPTLFKKRKLEKEMSANPAKETVRYRPPSPEKKVNGISKDDDSDDSATGEYIEVK